MPVCVQGELSHCLLAKGSSTFQRGHSPLSCFLSLELQRWGIIIPVYAFFSLQCTFSMSLVYCSLWQFYDLDYLPSKHQLIMKNQRKLKRYF